MKLESVPLKKQLPVDTLGKFVTVIQRDHAGFNSDESRLYVRGESVELWNK